MKDFQDTNDPAWPPRLAAEDREIDKQRERTNTWLWGFTCGLLAAVPLSWLFSLLHWPIR